MSETTAISNNDKAILKDLAKKRQEYANSPRNLENIRLWYKHNACKGERPMVHVEINTFQEELIPKRLKCEGELARRLEIDMLHNMINFEILEDDRPVIPYFPVPNRVWPVPFGLHVKLEPATSGIGYHYAPYINDLERDFHLLGDTIMPIDKNADKAYIDAAECTFGDILPVKKTLNSISMSPTQTLVALMSMETMFVSMYDYPELFHAMMQHFATDMLKYLDHLEVEGFILPTTGAETLYQGSWCFTDELPQDAKAVSHVWGYMDSQETVGLSPDMYAEFIFPYYKQIADRFGLLSYGCCEPVHSVWDSIKQFSSLRKLSISPWCDEALIGERLQGKNIIYHRKPAPHFIGVGTTLDEDAVRENISQTIKAAKGVPLEITQRDVYTINNDEQKARRYVELIREVIEDEWKG